MSAIQVPPFYDGSSQLDGDNNGSIGNVDSNATATQVGQLAYFSNTNGKVIANSTLIASGNSIFSNGGTLQNFNTLSSSGDLTLTSGTTNAFVFVSAKGTGDVIISSDTGSIQLNRPVTNLGGDLILNPNANINCSNKILSNVLQINTVSITAPANLTISPAGSSIDFNSKNLITISSVQTAVLTSTANLSINPSGTSVLFNSKKLTQVAELNCGGNTSTLGQQKIRVYDDAGVNQYGFGVLPGVLSYESPGSGTHIFYIGGVEKVRVASAALSLSVQITTQTGDLSLNPAGSNINCNSKILTNAIIAPSDSGTYTMSNANWTNSATIYAERIGRTVHFRIHATAVLTCNTTSAFFSAAILPTNLQPEATRTAQIPAIATVNGALTAVCILIQNGGVVQIGTASGGTFASTTTITLTTSSIYGSYITA
jgi:hypothetical protein